MTQAPAPATPASPLTGRPGAGHSTLAAPPAHPAARVDDAVSRTAARLGNHSLPDPSAGARETLRGAGRQGAQSQRGLRRPQRAAGVGRHRRQLMGRREGRAGRAGRWPSRPRRCTKRRSRSTATSSTARPTTAWACCTTRCRAGPRLRRQGQGQGTPAEGAGDQSARASTRTTSTASTWSRPGMRTRPPPTSNARCRPRPGRAARSPTPDGARRRARCWRRPRRS